jgi:pre-mRNA-processing factor SLU7
MSAAAELEANKKRKEDRDKRQAGELPPETDEVTGKMINPHNPDFITKKPWYLGQESGPTLQHQAVQLDNVKRELSLSDADALYARKQAEQRALKQKAAQQRVVGYRQGACKNCGAMTHSEKECVERPRSLKKSAYKTGLDIAADEATLSLKDHGKVSYTAKRDAWQGYDPSEYKDTISKFERIETARLAEVQVQRAKEIQQAAIQREEKRRAKELSRQERASASAADGADGDRASAGAASVDDSTDSSSDDEPEFAVDVRSHGSEAASELSIEELAKAELKAGDAEKTGFQGRMARQGGVGGAQMMVTARNLRIREDRPKYLHNLDLDSAHYDPKSRSMRENPTPGAALGSSTFAGDNFVRYTGDAVELAKQQILSWEMQARGEDVDVIANPSQMELVAREVSAKKKEATQAKVGQLVERYGNAAAAAVARTSKPTAIASSSQSEAKTGALAAAYSFSSTGSASGGGNPFSVELDPRLRFGQTETYQEYLPDGRKRVASQAETAMSAAQSGKAQTREGDKVREQIKNKPKYNEDVFEGNHSSVWGSYFSRASNQWGYACCCQLSRHSFCTGEAGRAAVRDVLANAKESLERLKEKKAKNAELGASSSSFSSSSSSSKSTTANAPLAPSAGNSQASTAPAAAFTRRSDLYGESTKTPHLDSDKMNAAIARAESWQAQASGGGGDSQTKKRKGEGEAKSAAGRYNGSDVIVPGDPSQAVSSRVLTAGGLDSHSKKSNSGGAAGEGSGEVGVEDMEVYRLKRLKHDDPMLGLLDSEEVLEYR